MRRAPSLPAGATNVADAGGADLDVLVWQRPAAGRLRFTGTWQGSAVEIYLAERRREDFLLLGRGYRWINETPYNR